MIPMELPWMVLAFLLSRMCWLLLSGQMERPRVTIHPLTRWMFCCDCGVTIPLDEHGQCSVCGRDSVMARYVPPRRSPEWQKSEPSSL